MKKSLGMFLLGATLAFGLACAAYIVSRAAVKVTRSETIRVKGSASQLVSSDFGSWSGGIAVAAPTMEAAAQKLTAAEKEINEFISTVGFRPDEVVWGSITINIFYKKNEKGINTNDILKFQLSRSLAISSKDVRRLEKLDRTYTDLVKKGHSVSNYGASYLITNLDDYKMKLLNTATENGYKRAQTLAGSAGGKVGALLSASQGIFQILAPGGGDISDYGTYDKSTIRKEVKAVVTLEFNLKSKR